MNGAQLQRSCCSHHLIPQILSLRQVCTSPGQCNQRTVVCRFTDEIPIPVQEPGSGKTRTARLWVYMQDDRNAGSQLPPAVWFAYSPDRKGIHPQQYIAGYGDILQADAYGGYNALYEDGRINEAACMAHAGEKSTTLTSVRRQISQPKR